MNISFLLKYIPSKLKWTKLNEVSPLFPFTKILNAKFPKAKDFCCWKPHRWGQIFPLTSQFSIFTLIKFVNYYISLLISFPIQTLSQSQSLSDMVGGVENLAGTHSGWTYVTSPLVLGMVEHVESESHVKKEKEDKNKKKKRCLHQVCQMPNIWYLTHTKHQKITLLKCCFKCQNI